MGYTFPARWKARKLDQLGFVGRGRSRHRPRNEPFLYGGEYPFFQTGDIKAANLYLTAYSQTYNEKGLAQSKQWDPGTLCITIAANIADTAILGIRGCFPDSVIGFIADPVEADVRFIKYYIDLIKLDMQQVSHGTTQDNLSQDKLLRFDFVVPDVEEQRKIAAILSAYDNLIENNLRRIKILEGMAQNLYREWFVKFRFPGHQHARLTDSPLGQIPEGWKVTGAMENKNWSFIRQSIGPYKGVKRYYATADIAEITICGDGIEYTYSGKPSRAQKQPLLNSVWFARMQETYKVLAVAKPNAILTANSMLSSGFAGFEAPEEDSFPFLFLTIKSEEFNSQKDRYCTGATQRSLTNDGLSRILTISPPREIVKHFGRAAISLVELILVLQERNQILRRTRDLLLPRLISGEVDVSELDIAVPEEASA
jgi:type I restriction enzyme S subunit